MGGKLANQAGLAFWSFLLPFVCQATFAFDANDSLGQASRTGADADNARSQTVNREDPNAVLFLWEKFTRVGRSAMAQDKFGEAENMFKKALEEAQFLQDKYLQISLYDLAYVYQKQSKWDQAESYYKRALELNTKSAPANDAEMLKAMANLSEVYLGQGKYAEAEPLMRKILAAKNLSVNDPELPTNINNLAEVLTAQEKYDQALPLYQVSLDLLQKSSGDPLNIATVSSNLAHIYDVQGNLAEAKSLYVQALRLDQKVLGPNHPTVINDMVNLAGIHQKLNETGEAKYLYKECLESMQRSGQRSGKKSGSASDPDFAKIKQSYDELVQSSASAPASTPALP